MRSCENPGPWLICQEHKQCGLSGECGEGGVLRPRLDAAGVLEGAGSDSHSFILWSPGALTGCPSRHQADHPEAQKGVRPQGSVSGLGWLQWHGPALHRDLGAAAPGRAPWLQLVLELHLWAWSLLGSPGLPEGHLGLGCEEGAVGFVCPFVCSERWIAGAEFEVIVLRPGAKM